MSDVFLNFRELHRLMKTAQAFEFGLFRECRVISFTLLSEGQTIQFFNRTHYQQLGPTRIEIEMIAERDTRIDLTCFSYLIDGAPPGLGLFLDPPVPRLDEKEEV